MTKYSVVLTVDATITVEVEADSAEEAKEKALDCAGSPGLCYHCANQIDIGDVQEAVDAHELGED